MSFLAKLAQIILKGTTILTGLGPIVPTSGAVVAKAESELTSIASLVGMAQAIGMVLHTPGEEKARAIGPLVAQEILKSSLMLNKKIADPDGFNKACITIAGGMADLLHSLHEDAAGEISKT